MINNPKLLEDLKNKIKNTPKEIFDKAFEAIEKEDFNEYLISQFPWLQIRNVYTDMAIKDSKFTWFDDIPDGWKKSFGLDMVKELDNILKKCNYQDKYRIVQIKEKWRIYSLV